MRNLSSPPFTDRQSLLAQLPAIAAPYSALYQALWTQPHVPATVLELCHRRLAQLHGAAAPAPAPNSALTPPTIAALPHWPTDPAFAAPERACLAFAEVYVMDTQALTDAHADAVKACFGEPGLVLLIEALGIFDGMLRLHLLWQLSAVDATDLDDTP